MATNNAINNSGSLVLLEQHTASTSASIAFTSYYSTKYNNYFLVIDNCFVVSTSFLNIQVSTNGGSSYISSGYSAGRLSITYTGTFANGNSTTEIQITGNILTTQGFSGTYWLQGFSSGNIGTVSGSLSFFNSGSAITENYISASTGVSSINAFQLILSTGNILSGSFYLYGLLE